MRIERIAPTKRMQNKPTFLRRVIKAATVAITFEISAQVIRPKLKSVDPGKPMNYPGIPSFGRPSIPLFDPK
jgi:hypothetical protein